LKPIALLLGPLPAGFHQSGISALGKILGHLIKPALRNKAGQDHRRGILKEILLIKKISHPDRKLDFSFFLGYILSILF
jgi:hypothetical protein